MERIDELSYYKVIDVEGETTMDEFGRENVDNYQQDMGYGYRELIQSKEGHKSKEKCLKSYKKVILMDKVSHYS